jgi:alkylated DNA repair dioxygenase AlkB
MHEAGLERIALDGGELLWVPRFLDPDDADAALAAIDAAIAWERHHVRIFGRELPAPRLSCWIGDPGAAYTYSRVRFAPHPWPCVLDPLRAKVSALAAESFNSVLANRYADGGDSMGWHADDEPELGPRPVIASLSLGATRRFLLRRRGANLRHELALHHGSLLVMRGDTQAHWQHALPRTAKPVGLRINLTFRRIVNLTTA